MSIEKSRGYIATCDLCGETLPIEPDYRDAVQAKKDAGWKSVKDEDGEWCDMCLGCQEMGCDS